MGQNHMNMEISAEVEGWSMEFHMYKTLQCTKSFHYTPNLIVGKRYEEIKPDHNIGCDPRFPLMLYVIDESGECYPYPDFCFQDDEGIIIRRV